MIQTTQGFLKRLPTPTVTARATSTPYKEACPPCSVLMDLGASITSTELPRGSGHSDADA